MAGRTQTEEQLFQTARAALDALITETRRVRGLVGGGGGDYVEYMVVNNLTTSYGLELKDWYQNQNEDRFADLFADPPNQNEDRSADLFGDCLSS